MEIACINLGYYYVKGDFNKSFRSVCQEASIDEIGSTSDIIGLDGKFYAIGNGGICIDKDKSCSINNKLLVLRMLCCYMDNVSSKHFKVAITAPPMTFSHQKDALPQYLKGAYKITLNGTPKEIFIDDVVVYPETIMAYLANSPSQFKKPVLVIDIGGLTTNMVRIENGSYSKDTVTSFTNGMYHVENKICQYLNEKYWEYLELDSASIYPLLEEGIYLNGGDKNIIEEEKDAINKIFDSFVKKISEKITLNRWNPTICDILVTGGGGKLLFNNIKKVYPQAKLSKDPIFDNLNGVKAMVARQHLSLTREIAAERR